MMLGQNIIGHEEAERKRREEEEERKRQEAERLAMEQQKQEQQHLAVQEEQTSQSYPNENANNMLSSSHGEVKQEPMSEEQRKEWLINEAYKKTVEFEKPIPHPYVDTTGHKTIGIGTNINDENAFYSINWTLENGEKANQMHKDKGYNSLSVYGKNNYNADFYKNKTRLRISDEEAKRLAENHIANDYDKLSSGIPTWGELPDPVRSVLMDLRYNTGAISTDKWPSLREGLDERNYQKVLENVNRKDVQEPRNAWAWEQIEKTKDDPYWWRRY